MTFYLKVQAVCFRLILILSALNIIGFVPIMTSHRVLIFSTDCTSWAGGGGGRILFMGEIVGGHKH